MLRAEVWEEGVTCRPRGSQLGWELGPGKIHVIFKQEKKNKNIILAFIEHLLVLGTLYKSVLIIPLTTWEVALLSPFYI